MRLIHYSLIYAAVIITLLVSCQNNTKDQAGSEVDALSGDDSEWVSMFNGKNLDGWTPKIVGHKAGVNWKNTFQVEDGVLKVNYAEYDTFAGEFGHLFYKRPFSKYRLKLEYRFTGDQIEGGAGWAYRNNGIMFHSQSAASMGLDQAFPVSLEYQFLGGDGTGKPRTSGCLCTPGLNVIVADTLNSTHCIPNAGPTIDGDEWVQAELYVDGSQMMHHIINGDTVMTYRHPTVGGGHLPELYPFDEGTIIDQGYIALQSETAPTEFRNIKIQNLE